jgi:predicted transcriptional regulator of viral defense system
MPRVDSGNDEQMKPQTQKKARQHFGRISNKVFSRNDLSDILDAHRPGWEALELSTIGLIEFLVHKELLKEAVFASVKYSPIVRYVRGNPSPYALALSLRKESFLSHQSALELHGLAPSGTIIYVNREQSQKPAPEGMAQGSINLAFKTAQRRSNYVFDHAGFRYVLVAGKNSGRAGVVVASIAANETGAVTDLERTLIDIVVRPAYAGGLECISRVYGESACKVDIDHMIELLKTLDYAYPYHQSIGFLLERAGRPEADCSKLRKIGTVFDFYLDYGLKQPAYNRKWRLYYPRSLDPAR